MRVLTGTDVSAIEQEGDGLLVSTRAGEWAAEVVLVVTGAAPVVATSATTREPST